MAVSDSTLVSFAMLEYRRDSRFATYVDNIVGMMRQAGAIRPGMPLETTLRQELSTGELCAKALLRGYHSLSDQAQWLKLRQVDG